MPCRAVDMGTDLVWRWLNVRGVFKDVRGRKIHNFI
jgi:hypothetical protein